MLSYYRNNLIHAFINHSEIACSLLGLSSVFNPIQGIPIDMIREKCWYLQSFLSEEFVIKKVMKSKEDFLKEL